MQRDILYLGTFRFPVKRAAATIRGYLSNATDYELIFNLKIQCKSADVVIGRRRDRWQPMIYQQRIKFPFRDWRKIVGQKVCRTSNDTVEPGTMYVFEHDDMETSEIRFTSRKGTWFGVDWKFVWVDFTRRLKGRVRTKVKFTDVTIWLEEIDTRAKAKRRLRQELDLSLFSEPARRKPYSDHGPQFKFRPRP
jgi:hypothetical protein